MPPPRVGPIGTIGWSTTKTAPLSTPPALWSASVLGPRLPSRPILLIVAPTVVLGEDGGSNMDLLNAEDRASFVGALNMELGIYRDECRVFAPFYRQATLAMYDAGGDALDSAIDAAYADVAAAFEAYLEASPDRPLVLAGFSRGPSM